MNRFFLFLTLVLLTISGNSQITTLPELPTASKSVTIIFDSSKESQLGYFTGDLYAHTGVKIEGKTNWQHVIESWGNNSTQPKLTNKGNGIYELEINPDIITYYSVPSNEKIIQLAFVFRSADASKQTNDLFVDVYEDGLVVDITVPAANHILQKNIPITISARSSIEANLKLRINENEIFAGNGKEISTNHTFTQSGNFWLIAEAFANNETVYDSVLVFVRDEVLLQTKPETYKKGINYVSDNSVALVLWAPFKEHVFVVGDFNNWEYSNNFLMKKDGDYFWLEIQNLDKGKEYAFQYIIDGNIRIADPYAEKILDPWNDSEIIETVYPNLKSYPVGKTEGIVSVFQTAQENFNWEIENFQIPEKEKLVIYELLIRDFTEERTYKSVREKLDYLDDLNINVLELMPVNEFEGNNSWGYNPSFYFAPDKYYGPKNELKKLIDECHKRGIAVVIDMVLNHSYGQSPFVQMYMDNWTILPENPWYNVSSPNQVFQWGFDFNHEAAAVEQLIDSVNSFWMNEYKVDGFRFDFTKGFTQTPGDGWAYDAPRIENLKRMANEIWKRKPGALVILEHLSENSEETELANHGMLLWGNMHGSYLQAARGNVSESDLSWAVYSERNWNEPNLVSYPESHDEERIMYEVKLNGLSTSTYNTKNQQTALDRIELNALFHILLPGPKMIWQFGERGYDLSINRCTNGTVSNCRLDPKPPFWQYLNNQTRVDVFRVMSRLNHLKQTYNEFSASEFRYNLENDIKWFTFYDQYHVFALGNFNIEHREIQIAFPDTGKWYEYFTGDSITITEVGTNFQLNPGEYRLYTTRKINQIQIATNNTKKQPIPRELTIYPNPASSELNIMSNEPIEEIQIFSPDGKKINHSNSISNSSATINVSNFKRGIYIIKVKLKHQIITRKILVN